MYDSPASSRAKNFTYHLLSSDTHGGIMQRRLDPGKETLKGFFQVLNHKEYQNVVIISFVHLEKISTFCFMYKGV